MKITEKQLQLLLVLLQDSVKKNVVSLFSFDFDARVKLLNEIIQQQSNTPQEVENE